MNKFFNLLVIVSFCFSTLALAKEEAKKDAKAPAKTEDTVKKDEKSPEPTKAPEKKDEKPAKKKPKAEGC